MNTQFDVVIIGGAFSGAATGLLLRRRNSELRVLIVEKAAEFDRKVGESTTEVSSCFLTKVLGVGAHLGHHQLNKQGLRMWFARTSDEPFEKCAELGARYNSRLSGFQVDRATLDEHVLGLAVEAGCELWRPAKVTALKLGGAGKNALSIKMGEETREVTAGWVVDASGRAAVISRKLELFRPMPEHPINALWGRFKGVKDWDGYELRKKYPCWAKATRTARGWATNHLMGLGWWCWIIPLKGGDTSIGLVYDARLFQPPQGGTIAERLKAHFETHPVGREMLSDVEVVENDQRAYSALPYYSERVAGDGWVLVGDASAFLDPLYSPGLDFCGFTAHIAHSLVARALAGEEVSQEIAGYNERFAFCYRSWFDGIYRDKYYYIGDADLMAAAFLLDIASYHLGPVRQVYSDPSTQFDFLPFDGIPGRIVACILRFYNARLVHLAQRRLAAGVYGRRNAEWRLLIGGFLPDGTSGRLLLCGIGRWLRAEWQNLFLPAASPNHEAVAPDTVRPEEAPVN
ncbi:MAG TPA: NAD(P)/FAD-dependent oxidoreductase [Chthoniobacteraceae bacterium]